MFPPLGFAAAPLLVIMASLDVSGDRGRAEAVAEDQRILKAAGIALDGPALLDFFRKRTLTPAAQAKIEEAIRQLGDRTFRVREKATAELIAAGPVALAFLREALGSADF